MRPGSHAKWERDLEPAGNNPPVIQARVLVVDDDPILRTQIERLGSRFVSELRLAKDGAEGLEIWRQWQPHVTVTDILMPEMDGLEMSRAIKAEDPDAQIIVITSDQDHVNLRRALEIGVERYIGKPVDMHLLADALRKCVRDRQRHEELHLARQVARLSRELQEQLEEKRRAEAALQHEKAEQEVLIRRLEEAHNQLLQSEKMASLGQLAAGVAHEINNPVGFVSSNLGTLRSYAQRLLGLLQSYDQALAALPADSPPRQAIARAKDEADAEYLQDDMLALIAESHAGVDRVRRIVQDLNTFSHSGPSEWQWTDLHQCIDSTLNLLAYEIRQKVDIVKEYGAIPEVECLPSQLNQVFLNLLVNAAQAIAEHGRITIRTGSGNGEVWVEIADTGSGIVPENINRIFDPFFTTKPVGAGTGLGLSITYGIIRTHKGRIDVSSQPGQGTIFRITIPERQSDDPS